MKNPLIYYDTCFEGMSREGLFFLLTSELLIVSIAVPLISLSEAMQVLKT